MRWILRILKWMGLGVSLLLFVAVMVLWARSMGHSERWEFRRFEAHHDWKTPPLPGHGVWRTCSIAAVHGRLWLEVFNWAPSPEWESGMQGWREKVTADGARQQFEAVFVPSERTWKDGNERAWRLAGLGFGYQHDAVAPETGRPLHENYRLAIPFWMLAVVIGMWPLVFVVLRVLRRKRFGAGMCAQCGYDLRATPERCPECGKVMKTEG